MEATADDIIDEGIKMMDAKLRHPKPEPKPINYDPERSVNQYYTDTDFKERRRLDVQQRLLRNFDSPVYDSTMKGDHDLAVLDLGCNNGTFTMARLGTRPEVKFICGVESDEEAVDSANSAFQSSMIEFYECDVESDKLDDVLLEYLRTRHLSCFDFINISMLMLHLKDPVKMLTTVRKYMNENSVIYIRDIDDGLALAYPDPHKKFERVVNICNYLETSGFRKSGRQIYSILKEAGFEHVILAKQGLSTVGMSAEERAALFHVYFSFIQDDLEIMCRRHPEDERCRADRAWYTNVYNELEEEFNKDNFFYQVGFMGFLAKK